MEEQIKIMHFAFWLIANYVQQWSKNKLDFVYISRNKTFVLTNGSDKYYNEICDKYGISLKEAYSEFENYLKTN